MLMFDTSFVKYTDEEHHVPLLLMHPAQADTANLRETLSWAIR